MEFDLTAIYVMTVIVTVMFAIAARMIGKPMGIGALWGVLTGLTVCSTTAGLAHAVAVPYTSSVVSQKVWLGSFIGLLICAAIAGGVILRAKLRKDNPSKP